MEADKAKRNESVQRNFKIHIWIFLPFILTSTSQSATLFESIKDKLHRMLLLSNWCQQKKRNGNGGFPPLIVCAARTSVACGPESLFGGSV